MKTLLYLLLISLFVFTSCEREDEITGLDVSQNKENFKLDVCHYDVDNDTWIIINIAEIAYMKGHLEHGDKELIDQDGDGWVEAINNCVPGGDSDDNDATVNPGAEEICEDITPPVIICPADVTVSCEEDSSPANTGMPSATDDCDGNVTITYTDLISPLPPQPGFSCSCDGGMVTLTVRYNGTNGATVDVYYDTGVLLATFTNVFDGDILTVDATSVGQIKLKADTRFTVNNGPERKIHTSCSQSILDLTIGEFTVIGWLDVDGQICEDYNNNGLCTDTSIERTWTATDASGNKASCTQTILIIDLSANAKIAVEGKPD